MVLSSQKIYNKIFIATMGVSGASNLLYRSPQLDLRQLHAVLTVRARRPGAAPLGQQRRPCIDVDANQVGFTQLKGAAGPASGTFHVGRGIGIAGIDVNYVCDGPSRHHSKRASRQRASLRERDRLAYFQAKTELATLLQSEGRQEEAVKKLEKLIVKKRRSYQRALPANFATILEELVANESSKPDALPSHGELSFLSDENQADPLMAIRAREKVTDAILSNDSDFAAHLGDDGLFIKEFCYSPREQSVSKFVLSTGNKVVAEMWAGILQQNYTAVDGQEAPVWIVEPTSPVFEGMADPRLRALVAVGLGCDTWPGGVTNLAQVI
jgi:hypothetical protein